MSQWYVKQLSQLTHISVQTLHHYDRIDLLKPSVRLPNGYRVYSEKDLSKLQQIIALKFFGFELSQIKLLLNKEIDLLEHFMQQADLLEERSKIFLQASQSLKNVIAQCNQDKSIHWDYTLKLIEVYHIMSELEKTWVGKALNKEELKEYADLRQSLKDKLSTNEIDSIEQEWHAILTSVQNNISEKPDSDIGVAIGKRCMTWVNKVYGDRRSLANATWEKGFKGGHASKELNIPQEVITWLDKAIDSYYRRRIWEALSEVGKKDDADVKKKWDQLLYEMFSDDDQGKQQALKQVIQETTSEKVIAWIRKYYHI